jgi:PadR family transcriptional regulator, regulatory protein PadR
MSELPRMSRQAIWVLEAFVRAPREWRYGYDLISVTGVSAGTLYPLLSRLTHLGWLDTKWEKSTEPGRPQRHLYRLTASGYRGAREAISRGAERGWTGKRPALAKAR